VTWADAELNPKGIEQARKIGELFVKWKKENGMPSPGTIYTSPLRRCLGTTKQIYNGVHQQNGLDPRRVIKENLRERLTNHTCDSRSSRAWIEEHYPECSFEPGFKEEDELWKPKPNDPEDEDKHTSRVKSVLEDIFNTDSSQFVLMVTHSFAITALHLAVGSRPIRLLEGAMLAMLVKAEREPAIGGFEDMYRAERSQMQYNFTPKGNEIIRQFSQFWTHESAMRDDQAYFDGEKNHHYAPLNKWVKADTPFTNPSNPKLAENDEVFIIGNRASFDVAQYDKPSAAGMSMIHLLALPRKRIYNGVSLNKENVYLIDNMIDLFKSNWKKAEFRNKVLAHQREAIDNAKGRKDDEGYRLALKHYEELESSIHQLQAEDFKFGLHLFPDQSIPHLHLHIIAATKSMRKYSTSHHDQKTKDALEVRDMIRNGKVQVPTHDTTTTVTEAADCTTKITICECSDGCMVIAENGRFEKPGNLEICMEEYSKSHTWFIRLVDTTVKMVSIFAQDVMGQEVLEMLREDHLDKARPYNYTQLVAFQAAELLARIRAAKAQPEPEDWQSDLDATLLEFARIQVTGAIY